MDQPVDLLREGSGASKNLLPCKCAIGRSPERPCQIKGRDRIVRVSTSSKAGPSPPAERPETVLDAGSGPERRRRSCAQAESVIGTCVPPRANWSLTYPHRPHIPTRPPLRCPLHSAFARLRRAHSDRLKYPQVPSSRPIPVAGSRLLCAPGRPSRGLGHLQARLRAIPLRRRLESP